MKYQFKLKKGFTIHIDGIPYKYLGAGMVGTNTNLNKFYAEKEKWETEKKKHNVIHPQMVYLKHGLFNEYGELVMAIESATKAQGIAKQYNYTLKELY